MSKNTIKSLRIQNLLSFGEQPAETPLCNLNLLIGPNASGKSNLMEIIGLLRGAPKDFAAEVADSGGISDLLWRARREKKQRQQPSRWSSVPQA
jgi:predicted ATPase